MSRKFIERLDASQRAGTPVAYIHAAEDVRCIEEIGQYYSERAGVNVARWTVLDGWRGIGIEEGTGANGDAVGAIQAVCKTSNGIYLMQGSAYLDDPGTIQAVKDAVGILKNNRSLLCFVSSTLRVPAELEKDLPVLHFPLPDREELDGIFADLLAGVEMRSTSADEPMEKRARWAAVLKSTTKSVRSACVEAALGLTGLEAESAFSLSLVVNQCFDPEMINREKAAAVKKTDILEFMEPQEGMESIGGMQNLKNIIRELGHSYEPSARKYGIDLPKGILLTGPPGTGKSAVAKAIATEWKIPLIRFDIGRIFGKYVGESEARMRQAIELFETIGRVLIYADELEKSMGGMSGSGSSDAGTAKKVGGTLLTWMQEKKSPSLLVGAVNHPEHLPAEACRLGRWDAIFYVGLPTVSERMDILRIHLEKRQRNPRKLGLNLEALAQVTPDFSGAELEGLIKKAMRSAYSDGGREMTQADLLRIRPTIRPLAVSRKDEIAAMQKWAVEMAEPAGIPEAEAPPIKSSKRRSVEL